MNRAVTAILSALFLSTAISLSSAAADDQMRAGSIRGSVIDAETKSPLVGTNVILMGTTMGAATDLEGNFLIPNVPVGHYTLQFDYIGYAQLKKSDVIVRSQRVTSVQASLKASTLEMETITVTGGYFTPAEDQPTSAANFSHEEIRRAPGSAGDVSRILMSLPSVAKVDDQTNSLIVRGGSPVENAFFIDNIEIPNINHFPTQGSSGGPIGMVNVDFIQEVNFYTGGFSSIYGDRLSSIMDITFREGNTDEFDGQLDLNFAGFGGVAEGPLPGQRGSWLFSARRSYLDLVVKAFNVGTSVVPRYGDYQGKISCHVNPSHRLTLLGILGDDHNSPDQEAALEHEMVAYGDQDLTMGTTGLNWRALWGSNGYSNTSLSYTTQKFNEDFYETSTTMHLMRNRSLETSSILRNINHLRLGKGNSVEFGLEVKHLTADYDNFFAEYTDALGDTVPQFILDRRSSTDKMAAFISLTTRPLPRLATTLGLRWDHFTFSQNGALSPRCSFTWRLTDGTSLNGSTGLFRQSLPLVLLLQNGANKDLQIPRAVHYVIGVDHLLNENTKFTLEVYQKDYDHFPLDPTQPALFLIDELTYRYGFFFNHDRLSDTGRAYTRGLEVMVQKRLARDVYGLASASFFRSRYRGGDGIWRDRVFDNRAIFSLEGGYKPNNKWEFSIRWIYAGGPPYTPFDAEKSRAISRAVLDAERINASRYPDYHSMNLRFDRRFHFSGSNLVFYFSVWNIYDRKNVAQYFWNEVDNRQDVIYQWSVLPIFGLEYEF